MTDSQIVAALDDGQTVAVTLWGEARSQRIEGRIAVANVIRNRVQAQRAAFGIGWKQVCLKAFQFSTWLPQGGSENYRTTMEVGRRLVAGEVPGPILRECLWIADGAMAGAFGDNTRGSSHYMTSELYRTHPPAWARDVVPVVTIHDHVFFAGVV
jgi:hypothetical protein